MQLLRLVVSLIVQGLELQLGLHLRLDLQMGLHMRLRLCVLGRKRSMGKMLKLMLRRSLLLTQLQLSLWLGAHLDLSLWLGGHMNHLWSMGLSLLWSTGRLSLKLQLQCRMSLMRMIVNRWLRLLLSLLQLGLQQSQLLRQGLCLPLIRLSRMLLNQTWSLQGRMGLSLMSLSLKLQLQRRMIRQLNLWLNLQLSHGQGLLSRLMLSLPLSRNLHLLRRNVSLLSLLMSLKSGLGGVLSQGLLSQGLLSQVLLKGLLSLLLLS
jgi:hypothetical protein